MKDNLLLGINLNTPGYCFECVRTPLPAGGVRIYVSENLNYSLKEKTSNENFPALWIEIHLNKEKNITCAIIYRQHSCPKEFLDYLEKSLELYCSKNKSVYIFGDFNIDLLKIDTCNYSNYLLNIMFYVLFMHHDPDIFIPSYKFEYLVDLYTMRQSTSLWHPLHIPISASLRYHPRVHLCGCSRHS